MSDVEARYAPQWTREGIEDAPWSALSRFIVHAKRLTQLGHDTVSSRIYNLLVVFDYDKESPF